MFNISGFGLSAVVTASKTFPNSVIITDFADDSDPLDSPDFVINETGFGLNGDMVVWSKAGGIEVVLNLIPTSEGDTNLDILAEMNRVGKKKTSARDIINIVVTYPDGRVVTCSQGVVVTTTVMPSVAGIGRQKSRPYRYRFERIVKSMAPPGAQA